MNRASLCATLLAACALDACLSDKFIAADADASPADTRAETSMGDVVDVVDALDASSMIDAADDVDATAVDTGIADTRVVDAPSDTGVADTGVDVMIADTPSDGCVVASNPDASSPACAACVGDTYCASAAGPCVPRSCLGERARRIAACSPLADGIVTIDPDGAGGDDSFAVFCRDLASATPREYLPLQPAFNYSRTPISGCGAETELTTRFQRVRLLIDRSGARPRYEALASDVEFTDDGPAGACPSVVALRRSPRPFNNLWATANSCSYSFERGARVDLRDTGFALPSDFSGRYRTTTIRYGANWTGAFVDSPYGYNLRSAGDCAFSAPEAWHLQAAAGQIPYDLGTSVASEVLASLRLPLVKVNGAPSTQRLGDTCANPIPIALGPMDVGYSWGRSVGVEPATSTALVPTDASCRAVSSSQPVRYLSVTVPARERYVVVAAPRLDHEPNSAKPVLRLHDCALGTCLASSAWSGTRSRPELALDNSANASERTFVLSVSSADANYRTEAPRHTIHVFVRPDIPACASLTAADLVAPAPITPADATRTSASEVRFSWTLPMCTFGAVLDIASNSTFTSSPCRVGATVEPYCRFEIPPGATEATIPLPRVNGFAPGIYYWRLIPQQQRITASGTPFDSRRITGTATSPTRSLVIE
ncbi:MAG: hypothetical protein JNK05_01435 [Myxococcales bacterium]|nr:hypothetical protein [Myxococcales bacterium]